MYFNAFVFIFLRWRNGNKELRFVKNIESLCEGSKDVKTRFINTSQGSSEGTWYRLVAFEFYKIIKLCSIPKSNTHDANHQ